MATGSIAHSTNRPARCSRAKNAGVLVTHALLFLIGLTLGYLMSGFVLGPGVLAVSIGAALGAVLAWWPRPHRKARNMPIPDHVGPYSRRVKQPAARAR